MDVKRTHTCGELTEKSVGREVTLCGWVGKRRDHGGLVFTDLRDRYGITQVVFDPAVAEAKTAHELAGEIRNEFVLRCRGVVRARPGGMVNDKIATGQIEVACTELDILSRADTPPFMVDDEQEVSDAIRLKHRYLDLRRPTLQKNLMIRSRAMSIVRNHLEENAFLEIETPILYKSTPEGARDFIVPSRLWPGNFYALPQSPQTLKQLLMMGGMDRYYQISRCFRDEDLRADRQPEFSQVDIEASFIDEDALFPVMESMMAKLWKDILGQEIKTPFPRMKYAEAMDRFGSDKPDVRFGLELQDLSSLFAASEFRVFKSALDPSASGRKGSVRGILVKGEAENFSRKILDELQAEAGKFGSKGLLWIKVQAGGELQSPAAKFLTDDEKSGLVKELGLEEKDLVLIVADSRNKVVFDSLGAVRLSLGERLGMIPPLGEGDPAFLWVTEFPLLEFSEEDGRFYALHHPFTSPAPEFVDDFLKGENLEDINASAYDLVLNGVEIGGGSLRIYRQDVQDAMFRALGISPEEAKDKFGFFLEALKYGTPPHGGIALGADRLAALLAGVGPIRDVMAFPKTAKGQCLMSMSPSRVSPEQLPELGISIRPGVLSEET